jgi:hypothetical protein
MDPIDSLPPDLSAVLSLLLRRGKSYGEIAELLRIPERSVRERAYAALDGIGDPPSSTTAGDSVGAADNLAGAAGDSVGAAGNLAGDSAPPPRSRPPTTPPPRTQRPAPAPPRTPISPSSRRAGALLLAAIVAVVAVVAIVVANSGGSSSHTTASTPATTSGSATTGTNANEPHIEKQLNLVAPDPSSKAVGLVEVLSQNSKQAFLVTAEHLPPTSGFFYAAWLYNSPSEARVLGRAPSVSSSGQLQAVGALPSDAGNFHQMLITRETETKPSHPGPVVLSGPFSLH